MGLMLPRTCYQSISLTWETCFAAQHLWVLLPPGPSHLGLRFGGGKIGRVLVFLSTSPSLIPTSLVPAGGEEEPTPLPCACFQTAKGSFLLPRPCAPMPGSGPGATLRLGCVGRALMSWFAHPRLRSSPPACSLHGSAPQPVFSWL